MSGDLTEGSLTIGSSGGGRSTGGLPVLAISLRCIRNTKSH
jgi:hypothetical protein